MKVICLLCDSLNRHFLSAYGKGEARTPNLDWFAQRSHVFEKHFSGSVPTMPTRRELWTGNYEFLWRPWGALEPWDKDLIGVLKDNDILTMLITDSYHLFERGSGNYHFKFDGWEFFRGFENDPWVTEPTPMPEFKGGLAERYNRNMRRMQEEEGLPLAKTLLCVEDWLQKNKDQENFFLMIDEFAPHEPFNTPDSYVKEYDPDYEGPLFFWPKYGKDLYDKGELKHLRATYSAHVTLLDKYIGRVFETMTKLNMWEDTAFILMTDHGHYLGEHGFTGKPACPPYNTLVHIPFMVSVPGDDKGGRVNALSANVDVYPTILDLFGIKPPSIHGRSVLPVIKGEAEKSRDWTLYGYYGRGANISDGKMTYLRTPRDPEAGLNIYSLRWEFGRFMGNVPPIDDTMELGKLMTGVDMPVGKLGVQSEYFSPDKWDVGDHLYDLDNDQEQKNNLAGGEQDKVYEDLLRTAMKDVGAPEEQFQRLGL